MRCCYILSCVQNDFLFDIPAPFSHPEAVSRHAGPIAAHQVFALVVAGIGRAREEHALITGGFFVGADAARLGIDYFKLA